MNDDVIVDPVQSAHSSAGSLGTASCSTYCVGSGVAWWCAAVRGVSPRGYEDGIAIQGGAVLCSLDAWLGG